MLEVFAFLMATPTATLIIAYATAYLAIMMSNRNCKAGQALREVTKQWQTRDEIHDYSSRAPPPPNRAPIILGPEDLHSLNQHAKFASLKRPKVSKRPRVQKLYS
ncbi:hypothetical protein E8E12_001222 [Didymella heteroderae]|uniref:Uncharacterized protein n=1 Tax=Didymella heteroderae TaxID=1769908 RepID=A0A9P5BWS2_9PLEO|nr:hypothetical protein E8E12_001222 [Didymella heteroderae]